MKFRHGTLWSALIAGAVAVPLAALGSHGKVGLWEVTTQVNMAGMMANIPPETLARMKAAGMNMSGVQTHSSQQCMTAEEVAQDNPPTPHKNQGCSFANLTRAGGNFTADLICNTSEAQGHGHVTVTYDSDEHYSGNYAFNGTMQGHPQNITSSFEGRWISADCGSAK